MLKMINKYDAKKVGDRIRDCRKETGITKDATAVRGEWSGKMSQEDLAKKCNVTRQTVAKWEKGELSLTVDDLLTLCNIFECDPGYLLCEYDCKHHITADIQAATGLSERAIEQLELWNEGISGFDNSYCWESDMLSQIIVHEKTKFLLSQLHSIAVDIAAGKCLLSVYNAEAKKEGLPTHDKIVWKITSDISKAIIESKKQPSSVRGQSALSAHREISTKQNTDEFQVSKIVAEMFSEIATNLANTDSNVKSMGTHIAKELFSEEVEKENAMLEILMQEDGVGAKQ